MILKMNKYFLPTVLALLLTPTIGAEGIKFEDLTLQEALDKAAVENKLVFVDCYTPTCGPCKMMAEKVFPLDECGDYFNPRFISLKKDLVADENKFIAEQYGVQIYPTFLFLKPDGSVYYKQDGGATRSAEKFLAKMDKIMAAGNYYDRFLKGQRDYEFIIGYINCFKGFNNLMLRQMMDSYVPSLSTDELTKATLWDIVTANITTTNSPAFRNLFERRNELAEKVGREALAEKFAAIFDYDYNQKKMMLRDFSSRISDIKTLEAEGLITPTLFVPMLEIRTIINNADDKSIDNIVAAVKVIGESSVAEEIKVNALKETAGIRNFTLQPNRQFVYTAVNDIASKLSQESQTALRQTLNALR